MAKKIILVCSQYEKETKKINSTLSIVILLASYQTHLVPGAYVFFMMYFVFMIICLEHYIQ